MTVRHVFVFRHCVRSPAAELNLLDANPSAYSTNPTDYLSSTASWPDWQTAPMWCTQGGSEILYGTGQYLVESYLPQFGATQQLRVHFVTDVDPRDVDTARDLMQGMATAKRQDANMMNIKGLNDLHYDPDLFSPTKSKWDADNPFCDEVPAAERNQYIKSRLGTIPKPGQVENILAMLEKYGGGVGPVGPLTDLPPTFVNTNVSDLGGQINVVEYMAQTAFYAAASNISFWGTSNKVSNSTTISNSNSTMTKTELFDLLAWNHYRRSVASVGNNHAALVGGVMMNRVLLSLAGDANLESNAENDQMVYFFIGHDGDLDNIATALGLAWELPPPYRSGKDGVWSPTPPNAGLHFSYDPNDKENRLSISVLTPMYFNAEGGEELALNKTGILEERPVVFANQDSSIKIVDKRTVLSSRDEQKNVLDDVRGRLEETLQTYEGAMECYQKAVAASTATPQSTPVPAPQGGTSMPSMSHPASYSPVANLPSPTPVHQLFHTDMPSLKHGPPPRSSSAKGQVFSTWMVFIVMSGGFIYLVRSVRRRRGRHGGGRSANYTEMGDVRHDLDLEMT